MSHSDKYDDAKQLQSISKRVFGDFGLEFNFTSKPSVHTNDVNAVVLEITPIIDGVSRTCADTRVIDVSGVSATDENGKFDWRLRNFIAPCDKLFFDFDIPMSFVATPHSVSPVYLTTNPKRGPFAPRDDVIVEVLTWDNTGAAAPRKVFSWRCRVPYRNPPIG